MCLAGAKTAPGRFLELSAGGVPFAACGVGFDVRDGDILGPWNEGGFVDGAMGTGDFLGRVEVGVKSTEREFAAEIWETGSSGVVRWRGWRRGTAVGRVGGIIEWWSKGKWWCSWPVHHNAWKMMLKITLHQARVAML